jgi:23S rRNA (cytosine1962-C5)-methyltransferase
MQLSTIQTWPGYELIDSGDHEKLERFGTRTLRRPDPQALWRKTIPEKEWDNANARFRQGGINDDGTEGGAWSHRLDFLPRWFVDYRYRSLRLRLYLKLTATKHNGIYPEQAENWNYIYDTVQEKINRLANSQTSTPSGGFKVLNLFAYTGAASLAARAAGADVTHVDSVRSILTWAHDNEQASALDGTHWVCEDVLKFAKREAKRGNRYQGLIIDPPAYGRGPAGEKWILNDSIAELLQACARLIDPTGSFCILNLYSMGFSPLVAENLVKEYFPHATNLESGELSIPDRAGRRLPLSVFARAKTND